MFFASGKMRTAAALASSLLVAACGGVGGSDRSITAEGMFVGTLDANRNITVLVTSTGPYYAFYSAPGNPQKIAGALQGTGTWSDTTFSSADMVDINLEGAGVANAIVSGTFSTAGVLNTAETYAALNKVTVISTTYTSAYEGRGDVTRLVGTYTGTLGSSLGTDTATLTVAANGAVTGSGTSGCVYSGAIAPGAKGNNYTFALTSGGTCQVGVMTVAGAAIIDPTTQRLYATGLLGTRTNGLVFAGSKS